MTSKRAWGRPRANRRTASTAGFQREIARKFEDDFGIKATIETPENITASFPLAAQAAQGPDIVIWAHDKVGDWADGGLIAPVELSESLANQLFPKARQAVVHGSRMWGYPIALETVTLIYNRALLGGSVPTELAQLALINRGLKEKRPGVIPLLWDYKSAYYSWGILASAGAYAFKPKGSGYDLNSIGVAAPGAVEGLSKIIALVHAGHRRADATICRYPGFYQLPVGLGTGLVGLGTVR